MTSSLVRLIQVANKYGLVVLISPSSKGMVLSVRDIGAIGEPQIGKLTSVMTESLINDPEALDVFISNAISSLILSLSEK